jgi:hypothetical protein
MDGLDPSSKPINDINVFFGEELSIEDVAQMDNLLNIMEAEEEVEAAANGNSNARHAMEQETYETVRAAEQEQAAAGLEPPPIIPRPIPIPPIRPVYHKVSGRYQGTIGAWRLVLRVDVDGTRPMRRVSGDYYRVAGSVVTYFGSFILESFTIRTTISRIVLDGIPRYTFSAGFPRIRVSIPRRLVWTTRPSATLQHLSLTGTSGTKYECGFESTYYRTIDLEEDSEQGVTPFVEYDCSQLPSGGPNRVLSVVKGYAEAGIDVRVSSASNVIPKPANAKQEWDNAMLHAAMEHHFSLWRDEPQWKVWLFHANKHVLGAGLLGIMFDQQGRQRQGAATFYQSIGGTSAVKQRYQLYTCVHELGHCFNLFHSFHKEFMTPPMPNRLDSKSWMNYPSRYRKSDGTGGESAFWSDFPFQFDPLEVIHLRHAFLNDIIIGGNPFGTGAALEQVLAFADPVEDRSGLQLELRVQENHYFMLGEPVVIEFKLATTDLRGKRVHSHLHPNMGYVDLAIQKPNGETIIYKPPIEHCILPVTTTLDQKTPAIYDSAYIGYSQEGLVFNQAGLYKIRALYNALDGSPIVSNTLEIRVLPPVSAQEREVTDLLLGNDQGMLFYLLGSDSEFLAKGNSALDQVLENHANSPMAVFARLVKGWNASREFKLLTEDNHIEVRAPEPEQAQEMLTAVVDASLEGEGLDNISLNQVMRTLAKTQAEAGDKESGMQTMDRMVDIFEEKKLKPQVLEAIREQAEETKASL